MFEESKVQKEKKRRKFDQIIKKKLKKIQANPQQKDYQQPNQHYQQTNRKPTVRAIDYAAIVT